MKGQQRGEKEWNKNEKEQGVKVRKQKVKLFFFLCVCVCVQKSQNFALCACPKSKVDLFDPERKASLVFILRTTFWVGNLVYQRS